MPLRPSSEGFISVLDALAGLLNAQFSRQLESIRRKQKSLVDRSAARLGAKFPDGFVEFALRDPRFDEIGDFSPIELDSDFRELCSSVCFQLQNMITSGKIYLQGESVIDRSIRHISGKDFSLLNTHEFSIEYITSKGFLKNYQISKITFHDIIRSIAPDVDNTPVPGRETKKTRGRRPEVTNGLKERLLKLTPQEFIELQGRKQEASATEYGVSRGTFRRALADVERERSLSKPISDN